MSDTTPLDGNEIQRRTVIEQAADAAVKKFALDNPHLVMPVQPIDPTPPPLKWAGILMIGTMSAVTGAGLLWLISSVATVQITVARIEERLSSQEVARLAKTTDIERRVEILERRDSERKPGVAH